MSVSESPVRKVCVDLTVWKTSLDGLKDEKAIFSPTHPLATGDQLDPQYAEKSELL